jgi:hypothetical protein
MGAPKEYVFWIPGQQDPNAPPGSVPSPGYQFVTGGIPGEGEVIIPEVGPIYIPPADPVNQYTNTGNEIVPIGTPQGGGFFAEVSRLPAYLAARMLPKGEVNPTVGWIVTVGLPWAILAAAAWYVYRRYKR